ncbi:MFS transporter [Streptosporangium roseum]|uniref:Membrane transport protein n=1 Tax=Streptosporangium roseum (strain ATCC 12428 / DSM 43021 / JCM 3005 / KCTC 9067 / NCIMB 10171 / NRRL 2505 / NI 9100) TaxID=479432 RepID=D2AXD9_STRRD|nr:MFS transporter [Streptosporangium roseum]ACZ83119.1 putative membrane transport protein [Streptosporangium roseum DSM 43021]
MHSYRRDLDILRDRRFTLLLVARTISVLGSSFAPVALAFGILALPGATATTLSVVLAAEALPMVAFMLVGGVIADRLPRHRVMMAGETINAAAFFCLAAMLLTGWTPLPALVTAAAVSGVAMAILFPALTGIIPDVVPADRLQTANALLGLGANSSRVAGLILSGATVVLLGGGWALVVSGAMFAVAAVLIAALRLTPAERSAAGSHSVLADLRGGWREFVSRQWLWVVVAQFSVLVMAVQAAHGVLGPLVAKEHLGGAAAWSAILAGEAVGMIGGVFVALRLRPRRPILVGTILTVPTALPYLLLGLGTPLWTIVLGAVVMGVCFDIFGVLWNTTMQREIPAESLSRVSSYDALGSLMFGPVGLLVAGPLAIVIGPRPALLGCAAVVVLSSLAALLSPGVRGLRAPAPAEETGALSH